MTKLNWSRATPVWGEQISRYRDPDERKADAVWRRKHTRKRFPIKCRDCKHKGAVHMTGEAFNKARFRCSKCGSRSIAKRI